MPSWFHLRSPHPPEDPAVAAIEEMLGVSRRYEPVTGLPKAATHAVSMCACVTMNDAPRWLLHDVDGGLMWCRVPSGIEGLGMVDARRAASGHADPAEVLLWLQGEAPDPWGRLGDGGGDSGALEALRRAVQSG